MRYLAVLDSVAHPALHEHADALAPHRATAAHREAEQRVVGRRRRVELGDADAHAARADARQVDALRVAEAFVLAERVY